MDVTVREIQNLPEFENLVLLAGETGLGNVVTKPGILDYEYDISVRGKYSAINFSKGQLVLTSLLYAKDNEHLLMESVRNLVDKGCSGLIIKNIFKIQVHDSVLRYADINRFPIFVTRGQQLYFEDMIYRITDFIQKRKQVHFPAEQADAILHTDLGDREIWERAKRMNPSFGSDIAAVYFHAKQPFSAADYLQMEEDFRAPKIYGNSDALFYYRGGAMLVHTRDLFSRKPIDELLPYLDLGPAIRERFFCGVSRCYHKLENIREAMFESIYAAIYPIRNSEQGYTLFQELGSCRLIFPLAQNAHMASFSEHYLKPLRDHDYENKTMLYETATAYVLNGGDITKTAETMRTHKNTIRYRLEAAGGLLQENVLHKANFENLSLAVKIHLCRERLRQIGM